MKKLSKILLALFIGLLFIPSVYAVSSKFTPKVKMKSYEIDNSDYVYLVLSYSGESVKEVEESITYNGRYLEFIDVEALNGFKVDSSGLIKEGKYRSVKISSEYTEDQGTAEYAVVTFRLLNTFKISDVTYIEIKDYKAYSQDGVSKYMYDGIEVTLSRETLNRVGMTYGNIDSKSKFRKKLTDYLTRFLMVVAILIIIIMLIAILPSKRELQSTNRDREASKKVNGLFYSKDNYKVDVESIKMIGEKPKEEPKNKLELGSFNPFKNNVAKREDAKFDESRDFKAVDISVFNQSKPNVDKSTNFEIKNEEAPKEEKAATKVSKSVAKAKEEMKKSQEEPKKKEVEQPKKKEPVIEPKKIDRKPAKEGKDGLIMISQNWLDDANSDDLD